MKKVRIQFEMSEKKAEGLKSLMEECGVSTKKELFNNALSLLEWSAEEIKAGQIIASINEDKHRYKELVMPWMKHLKNKETTT